MPTRLPTLRSTHAFRLARWVAFALAAAVVSSCGGTLDRRLAGLGLDRPASLTTDRGAPLSDPTSVAIGDALERVLGVRPVVRARLELGGEQLVVFTLNALSFWYARFEGRDALRAEVEACAAREEDVTYEECFDDALREVRSPEMLRAYLADCVPRTDGLNGATPEAYCAEQFRATVVFDLDAYRDGLYVARATPRSPDAFDVELLAMEQPVYLESVLDVHVADLDGDGQPELLVDRTEPHLDAMRLIQESQTRTLTILRRVGDTIETASSLKLAVRAVDLGSFPEPRCEVRFERGDVAAFRRTCCVLRPPEADESEDEFEESEDEFDESEDVEATDESAGDAAEARVEAPPAAASRPDPHARYAMPSGDACGPRFQERFALAPGLAFESCTTSTSEATVVRVDPSEDAEVVAELDPGTRLIPLRSVGRDLAVLVVDEWGFSGVGYVARSTTVRRCGADRWVAVPQPLSVESASGE